MKTFIEVQKNRHGKSVSMPRHERMARQVHVSENVHVPTIWNYYTRPPIAVLGLSIALTCTYATVHYDTLAIHIPEDDNFSRSWKYFTLLFAHSNVTHLLNNVALVLAAGVLLESLNGPISVVFLFVICGILGAMVQVLVMEIVRPLRSYYMLGASPGTYALVGAEMSNVALNWSVMPYAKVRVIAVSLLVIIESVVMFVDEETRDRTAYVSHIGGAVFGSLYGFGCLRVIPQDFRTRTMQKMSMVVAGVSSAVVAAARVIHWLET